MTSWERPPRVPVADGAEIHLWLFRLDAGGAALERLRESLDERERTRAARFRFPVHRGRFVVGRGTLRSILGLYLGVPADRVKLTTGPQGKPRLAGGPALEFNISHSEDRALLAVASGRCVGVDIERIDASRATEDIARRFFSPEEIAALDGIPRRDRTRAFFRCWTRKEAYLKALGDGLSLPLDGFAVSVDRPASPRLLRSDRGPAEVSRWRFADPRPIPGYAAALAAEGEGWRMRFWRCAPGLVGGR